MKPFTFFLIAILSLPAFSQHQLASSFDKFDLQCEAIGTSLIDTSIPTDIQDWYHGRQMEIAKTNIKQLEEDIDQALMDVTFKVTKQRENPLSYTIEFYNELTGEAYGQLFLLFIKEKSDQVFVLDYVSKEQLDLYDLSIDPNSRLATYQLKSNRLSYPPKF